MNLDLLDALMALMAEHGIEELDHTENGVRVHLKRAAQADPQQGVLAARPAPALHANVPVAAAPAATAEVSQNRAPAQEEITAPMVGVFYLAPAPDAPPFVKEGDVVAEGAALYILEVMKTLNRVVAEFACRIVRIAAKNGEMVEAGTPLFVVERINDADI
ncbi:acetyl-CoA carboxylase biotin carboxyl carrier protein subunit [Acetobacter sp. TBRC 12305]|uniref:Biotin carboxyl carrier protein of acetyl-CoA carboxylase n=1 Tax=Acetobacter garciniae TaxID=2817435 RepID=A0A939HPS7_9PROT|nr:biotin/lipoyl-containing protein [Acetobacter garciniae]MBO1325773.1 acetyl-CoA carboxylase biotin carboxyl carrier protein subunit [Acetobacter garciniae]MBX0345673.1 acetyl-CoA carboxylase biotin carboxyl carrier protein subunit [Acetobacter garciniae]